MRLEPFSLQVKDARELNEANWLGRRTDDDDRVHVLRAVNSVQEFVERVVHKVVAEMGLKVSQDAERVLEVSLAGLEVVENNQAVGATYAAEVRFDWKLSSGGQVLWRGTSHGDASRYGRKFSNANINEVISDALLEALAAGFSDPGLHEAWLKEPGAEQAEAGQPATKRIAALAPEELLAEVVELKELGLSETTLIKYVRRKVLSRSFGAEDVAEWKRAGVSEAVLQAAMECPVE